MHPRSWDLFQFGTTIYWLVVEPTHLKNMLVKLGSSSPNRDENKKYWKPPPSTSTSMDPVSCLGRHPVSQVIKLDHFPKSKSFLFSTKIVPKEIFEKLPATFPNTQSLKVYIFPARVTQQLRAIPFDQWHDIHPNRRHLPPFRLNLIALQRCFAAVDTHRQGAACGVLRPLWLASHMYI